MATATALGLQIARRVRDYSQSELDASAYLDYINMAIDDLTSAGWLQPQAIDETLTVTADTTEYAVPAGFAYIRWIDEEDSDGAYPLSLRVPAHHWSITNDAKIKIVPEWASELTTGRSLRLTGQKRPTSGIAGSATIVAGMESFIRERAISYAAEAMAMGDSNLAAYRQRLAEANWAKSQAMLANHPMEFRIKPSSIHVPGR